MPKKINVFQILLITIFAAAATKYILYRSKIRDITFSDSIVQEKVVPHVTTQNNKDSIGNLIFTYNNKFILNISQSYFIDLNTNFLHSNQDRFGKKNESNYFPIKFYLLKNDNPKKLSVEKYYLENAPANERQAPAPDIEEKVTINGYDAYQFIYANGAAEELHSPYYDIVTYFIPNGTDIYQIEGYRLPTTPSPDLTAEDITAAKEYEKAFDAILQSIEFIDPLKPELKPELM